MISCLPTHLSVGRKLNDTLYSLDGMLWMRMFQEPLPGKFLRTSWSCTFKRYIGSSEARITEGDVSLILYPHMTSIKLFSPNFYFFFFPNFVTSHETCSKEQERKSLTETVRSFERLCSDMKERVTKCIVRRSFWMKSDVIPQLLLQWFSLKSFVSKIPSFSDQKPADVRQRWSTRP